MKITDDIQYVGVNDYTTDLFEGMYAVPNGMSYNSYAIIDEKIAVMDTVADGFEQEWLGNIKAVLGDRTPDYLIVQHMEPDHSANIFNFVKAYPEVQIVSSAKAFVMMKNFFGTDFVNSFHGKFKTLCYRLIFFSINFSTFHFDNLTKSRIPCQILQSKRLTAPYLR